MNAGRCQICGRRKALSRLGTIVSHYVAGEKCLGIGAAPLEIDDRHMEIVIADLDARARRISQTIADLEERRANWIDPRLILERIEAACAAQRMRRRLSRHRDWPRRFEREMERQGYGMRPPEYLMKRREA